MDSKVVKIVGEKEDSRIHLQLPNLSGESSVSEDARGLEVDAESTADEEEILTRSRPNSLTSSNGTEDLYEMLHELPSIRNAAWALRKAIVTSSASSRKRSTHGESGVNQGKGSRKKVTFTRTCCADRAAGRHPKLDADANTSDCTSSSSIASDIVAEDGDRSKRNRRREPMQMHSINLYQSILPPSLFSRK